MELKAFRILFNRWAWLFVFLMIIGGVTGYFGSQLVTPSYRADAKIMIFRIQEDENDKTGFAFLNNKQIVETYLEMLKSTPLLEEAASRLNHDINSNENIRVSQIEDTQFIQISVEGTDPQRNALIANTLVDVLIEQNESIQIGRYLTIEENLNQRKTQIENQLAQLQTEFSQITAEDLQNQLDQVITQIDTLEEEITILYREIAELGTEAVLQIDARIAVADKEARLSQIQPQLLQYQEIRTNLEILGRPTSSGPNQEDLRLDQLRATIDLYQKVHLDILNSIETVELLRLQNTPNIVKIETASIPQVPFRPIPLLYGLFSSAIGLALAGAAAYLIESLYHPIKTVEQVQQFMDLPVLGFICEKEFKAVSKRGKMAEHGLSPVPEYIDALVTNLEFASEEESYKTLLLIGVDAGVDNSNVSVDMAMSYAEWGKKVALMDIDMNDPQVHTYFGLENEVGFSSILAGDLTILKGSTILKEANELAVITSGPSLQSAAGLIKSKSMDKMLTELQKDYDLIIIDSPSILSTDSWVLASKVDAVLLVIRPGKTGLYEAHEAVEKLNQVGAKTIGVVLNHIPKYLANNIS